MAVKVTAYEPSGHQRAEYSAGEAVQNEAVRKYLNGLYNRLTDEYSTTGRTRESGPS